MVTPGAATRRAFSYTGPVEEGPLTRPIRVLPALVANQIAAGEVVERPASVVKELVENALDAGARRVEVSLEQGGIELVEVTDDGVGIPREELTLALAPHATSKVTSAGDLDHIATLGFRGEALASISAVSRLTLLSRVRREDSAWRVEAEGESVSLARPASGSPGTTVSVRNLFFNTPARRKFLRTIGTEQERCVDALRQLALAHADVGFVCRCDGRTVLDLAPGQSPRERAEGILGKDVAPALLEVHADRYDDARGLTLWGLAGLPSIARGTAKHQHVFVNGRAIKDRTIQHAVAEAYRGLIDPSRYPTVVLMLEMSPEGVDVNVHPQKAEVRFRDSSMVHSVVLRAIRDALRGADLTPAVAMLQGPGRYRTPSDLPGTGLVPPSNAEEAKEMTARAIATFIEGVRNAGALLPEPAMDAAPGGLGVGGVADNRSAWIEPKPVPGPMPEAVIEAPRPETRVLQVHKSYLVTQDEQGVVIIDQHALHERVMFEYLLARVMSGGGLERQRLLSPVVVPATRSQVELLASIGSLLEKLGVEAHTLSPTSIGVSAFPSFLFARAVDPVEFMEALLEKAEGGPLGEEMKAGGERAMRDVLDMMACKAAVKAGDRLTEPELGELVRLREDVERSSNCPHGRPTSIRLTIRELERLFGRA